MLVIVSPSSSPSSCVASHTQRRQRGDRGDDERTAPERPAGDDQGEADDAVEQDEGDQQDAPLVVERPRGVIQSAG